MPNARSPISATTFLEAIERRGGNVTAVAADLDLSRPSVYRRADRLGLDIRQVRTDNGRSASGHTGRKKDPATLTKAKHRVARSFTIRRSISDEIESVSIDVTSAVRRHTFASEIVDQALELGLPLVRKKYGIAT